MGARINTLDHDETCHLEAQVLDLVLTDVTSGRDTARPEGRELLRFGRDGDTVVAHSMGQLATRRRFGGLPSKARPARVARGIRQGGTARHRRGPALWPSSCSQGGLRRIRRPPDPRRPKGRHRPDQAAGCLQGAENADEPVQPAATGAPNACSHGTTESAGKLSTSTCASPNCSVKRLPAPTGVTPRIPRLT